MKSFAEKVQAVVRDIPEGQTMTYGEVAAYAGSPGAARAVGNVMKHNFDPSVPCHRVVRSDGKVGEYNRGGPEKKAELLHREGVKI
jgi:O-6-methylguanine DNA methyltransferase